MFALIEALLSVGLRFHEGELRAALQRSVALTQRYRDNSERLLQFCSLLRRGNMPTRLGVYGLVIGGFTSLPAERPPARQTRQLLRPGPLQRQGLK